MPGGAYEGLKSHAVHDALGPQSYAVPTYYRLLACPDLMVQFQIRKRLRRDKLAVEEAGEGTDDSAEVGAGHELPADGEAPAPVEPADEGEAPVAGGDAAVADAAADFPGGEPEAEAQQQEGSRPTSAQQAGSRSQSQTSSRPLSQAGSMSVQGVPAASGSRPTSQQASREGSASGPRASSRQGSAAGSQHGSQAAHGR
eukprot:gene20055-26773_t